MKFLAKLALVAIGMVGSVTANAFTLNQMGGLWYNPNSSGQGFQIQVSSEGVSLTFFGFGNAQGTGVPQNQVWMVSSLEPASWSQGVFTLYRINQGALNTSALNSKTKVVGSVDFIPYSCETAVAYIDIADDTMNCSEQVTFGPGDAKHCHYAVALNRLTHASTCSL